MSPAPKRRANSSEWRRWKLHPRIAHRGNLRLLAVMYDSGRVPCSWEEVKWCIAVDHDTIRVNIEDCDAISCELHFGPKSIQSELLRLPAFVERQLHFRQFGNLVKRFAADNGDQSLAERRILRCRQGQADP